MSSHSTDHTMTRRSVLLAPMALVGAVAIPPRGAAPSIGFCIGTYGMKDLPAIHNPARALETLRLVSSPRLKICYDYCHMFVASESLESSLRALAPHLGLITLKDARWTDAGHRAPLERCRPRAAFTETERDPLNLGGRLF